VNYIGLFFAVPIFVMGLLICFGKFISLLAGFHTSDQQKDYNSKKVGRFVGAFLMLISVPIVFVTSEDLGISG